MRKIVELYALDEVALIIRHGSGVTYRNQVCGNTCAQEEAEGVLAPLATYGDAQQQIMASFDPSQGYGISSELADRLDAIFQLEPGTRSTRVDRTRLADSCEAWVYVTVDTPSPIGSEGSQSSYFGFGIVEAILTWPNSD
jgi:hypothetical protein